MDNSSLPRYKYFSHEDINTYLQEVSQENAENFKNNFLAFARKNYTIWGKNKDKRNRWEATQISNIFFEGENYQRIIEKIKQYECIDMLFNQQNSTPPSIVPGNPVNPSTKHSKQTARPTQPQNKATVLPGNNQPVSQLPHPRPPVLQKATSNPMINTSSQQNLTATAPHAHNHRPTTNSHPAQIGPQIIDLELDDDQENFVNQYPTDQKQTISLNIKVINTLEEQVKNNDFSSINQLVAIILKNNAEIHSKTKKWTREYLEQAHYAAQNQNYNLYRNFIESLIIEQNNISVPISNTDQLNQWISSMQSTHQRAIQHTQEPEYAEPIKQASTNRNKPTPTHSTPPSYLKYPLFKPLSDFTRTKSTKRPFENDEEELESDENSLEDKKSYRMYLNEHVINELINEINEGQCNKFTKLIGDILKYKGEIYSESTTEKKKKVAVDFSLDKEAFLSNKNLYIDFLKRLAVPENTVWVEIEEKKNYNAIRRWQQRNFPQDNLTKKPRIKKNQESIDNAPAETAAYSNQLYPTTLPVDDYYSAGWDSSSIFPDLQNTAQQPPLTPFNSYQSEYNDQFRDYTGDQSSLTSHFDPYASVPYND